MMTPEENLTMAELRGEDLSEHVVYPRAPITEALLDIRVKLREGTKLQDLEAFQSDIRERFPERKTRIALRANFPISGTEPPSVTTSHRPDGYMFRSPSEQKIVQARLDGFTFNKLKPYQQWTVFRDEARDLWNRYYEIANPITVKRIALRYINRIEIPYPLRDFKDYILTTPEIAPKLPQGLDHFFMRLVVPFPEKGVTAIITETVDKLTKESLLPLIFDIDVWQPVNYQGQAEAMWSDFEKLREIKNKIFSDSLTEKAKELFK